MQAAFLWPIGMNLQLFASRHSSPETFRITSAEHSGEAVALGSNADGQIKVQALQAAQAVQAAIYVESTNFWRFSRLER